MGENGELAINFYSMMGGKLIRNFDKKSVGWGS